MGIKIQEGGDVDLDRYEVVLHLICICFKDLYVDLIKDS